MANTRTLSISVDAGAGRDTINVLASNDVDITAGSTLSLNLTGRAGNDSIFVNYRGKLDGRLLYNIDSDSTILGLGDGNDSVTVRVFADDGSFGRVGDTTSPARVATGAGDDTIDVRIHQPAGLAVSAQVDAGGNFLFPGHDVVYHTTNVSVSGAESDTVVVFKPQDVSVAFRARSGKD